VYQQCFKRGLLPIHSGFGCDTSAFFVTYWPLLISKENTFTSWKLVFKIASWPLGVTQEAMASQTYFTRQSCMFLLLVKVAFMEKSKYVFYPMEALTLDHMASRCTLIPGGGVLHTKIKGVSEICSKPWKVRWVKQVVSSAIRSCTEIHQW